MIRKILFIHTYFSELICDCASLYLYVDLYVYRAQIMLLIDYYIAEWGSITFVSISKMWKPNRKYYLSERVIDHLSVSNPSFSILVITMDHISNCVQLKRTLLLPFGWVVLRSPSKDIIIISRRWFPITCLQLQRIWIHEILMKIILNRPIQLTL